MTSDKELKIVRPHVRYEETFKSGFSELQNDSDRKAWIYLGDKAYADYFTKSFSEYVDTLLLHETQASPNFVCDSIYWGICEGAVVGRVSLRHELNDFLLERGGHIGYIVRPSSRGKGFAGEMLAQILMTQKAHEIGRILLTCDEGNLASEKTIIKAGGLLENIISVGKKEPRKMRFWIDVNN